MGDSAIPAGGSKTAHNMKQIVVHDISVSRKEKYTDERMRNEYIFTREFADV